MAYHVDSYDNSIVIDGFEKGIADSPFDGISDMRNVNIISVPGEASVNFTMASVTLPSGGSGNVTSINETNNTVTVTGSAAASIVSGMSIRFGGLDANGLVSGTQYWVSTVTGTLTFTVSSNPLLSGVIDITGTGTGTFVTQTMGKPLHKTYNYFADTAYRYFILDDAGLAWGYNGSIGYFQYLGNTTLTNAYGNGLIAYQNYLFVFRNDKIDYVLISALGSTPIGPWVYGWQTLLSASSAINSHYALIGINDNIVYYCDSNGVGSFYQKDTAATFDPSSSATYTATASGSGTAKLALMIPSIDIAQCLAELGTNLLVGGKLNAIYPWNRVAQVSGKSINNGYSYPILLGENFITRMVTVNTNTYIFAGVRGRIYITNGSQASLYKKIPDHISGTVEPYFAWGDAGFMKNQLYFGVSCKNNAGTAINEYGGVWAIDLDTQALRLSNELSYGTYAGIASVIFPLVISSSTTTPAGAGLFVGYTSDSGAYPGGMDISTTSPYTGSQATIDSDLIPIGTYEKPRNFTRVEYRLTKALVSGESVVIKYRLLFDKFDQTTPAINTYATILTDSTAGNYSSVGSVNFSNAQWVQFQIVLNSTASTPSYTRLKEIRIKGLVQ